MRSSWWWKILVAPLVTVLVIGGTVTIRLMQGADIAKAGSSCLLPGAAVVAAALVGISLALHLERRRRVACLAAQVEQDIRDAEALIATSEL
jgi:hypothetical protein